MLAGVMQSGGKVTTVKDINGVSADPGGREALVCGLSIAGMVGSNPALRAWMFAFVFIMCCVLISLCNGLITHSGEHYFVCVCV